MNVWKGASNLKDHISYNPPVATFFLCLLTLALSFIVLSSYSYSHTLPNPDIEQDWNTILSSFSQFHLCEKENASSPLDTPPSLPHWTMVEKDKKALVNTTRSSSSVSVLHVHVPLTVTSSSPSATLKDIGLFTTVTAHHLKLGDKELVNLTLGILPEDSKQICLTISAPSYVLAMTQLLPECSASETNISSIPVEATNQLPSDQTCYSLHFKEDSALKVMLTLEEQSVAVNHLVEVSVGLLVICLFLCLAACLKNSLSHRDYLKGQEFQSEPLIEI